MAQKTTTDDAQHIDFGTESGVRADATAAVISPDMVGFADDDEHAVSFLFERVAPDRVLVETHFHEAGLDTHVRSQSKHIRNTEMSTEAIAREKAEHHANRKTMMVVADHFANDRTALSDL